MRLQKKRLVAAEEREAFFRRYYELESGCRAKCTLARSNIFTFSRGKIAYGHGMEHMDRVLIRRRGNTEGRKAVRRLIRIPAIHRSMAPNGAPSAESQSAT